MQFSIVIPFFEESPEVLFATVKSIRETQDYHHQIILIDDGNKDKLYGNILEKFGCELITNVKNLGVGPSRDLGAAIAKHNMLALFDSHIILERGWDIEVHNALLNRPNHIFSPLVKPLAGEVGKFGGGWCRTSEDVLFNLELAFEPANMIPSCYGGAFFVRKSWFDYLRGFAGLIQHGHEEVYLSAKSYGAGGGVSILNYPIRQNTRKIITPERRLSNSLNRLFINEVLFNAEYKDKLKDSVKPLLDTLKVAELKSYYSKILSPQLLKTWLDANAKIEQAIKPSNQ